MSEPLCPEHDLRAAMSDGEFWAHVLPDGEDPGALTGGPDE